MNDETNILTIYVISDSAGETATKLAQATMAQFPTVEFNLYRKTFVNDKEVLIKGLAEAKKHDAMILFTMINEELATLISDFCEESGLFSFDVSLLLSRKSNAVAVSLLLANLVHCIISIKIISNASKPWNLP